MDVVEMLAESTAWAATKVAGVRSEQLGDPTPCTEWNVRALLGHLIGGARLYASIARGDYTDELRGALRRERLDGDAATAYETARAGLLRAFAAPGVLDQTLASHHGDQRGSDLCALIASDHLIHGWDLAVATGQETTMPSHLVEPAFAVYQHVIPASTAFSPPVTVDDGVGLQHKLLAYCGRSAAD